jgi:VanZ family protein
MPKPNTLQPKTRSLLTSLALFLWAATLWWLSSRTMTTLPGPEIPHLDKFLHFGYFGLGGMLLAFLPHTIPSIPRLMLISFLVFGVIGGIDEWHQSWVPGRSGNDWGDWLADATGGPTGSLLVAWWRIRTVPSI